MLSVEVKRPRILPVLMRLASNSPSMRFPVSSLELQDWFWYYGLPAPTVGTGWELDTIAAIVIGGTRLFGGEGSLLKAMAGVLIYQIIANFMNLTGLDPFYQSIVRALLTIFAVGLGILREMQTERRTIHR
jgi:ribose/xylose/arabinose/galactoside ABC-type transport system permease subunit